MKCGEFYVATKPMNCTYLCTCQSKNLQYIYISISFKKYLVVPQDSIVALCTIKMSLLQGWQCFESSAANTITPLLSECIFGIKYPEWSVDVFSKMTIMIYTLMMHYKILIHNNRNTSMNIIFGP